MQEKGVRNGAFGADKFGFKDLAAVHWNLTEPSLYEHAISAGEASLVAGGALCAETGHHTGRSPKDKHTVVDDLTRDSCGGTATAKCRRKTSMCCSLISRNTPKAKSCSRRTSMAAPTRNTGSRRVFSPNSPGTRFSFGNC